MLSEDTIIRAENLSKSYRIWASPLARLRGPLLGRAAGVPLLPGAARTALRARAAASSREFFALRDVSFQVTRGQSVGIIGRNGAGKSTLLQILTGTLQPTAGAVEVRGRTAALLELGSGFNPEFTGRENVRLNATLHGLSPAEVDGRMDDILAFADIGDFVDQPVKTYSSGMLLRLAFAVIAHIDADLLIIDEALAVGDVFFIQKCMTFLRAFQEKGVLLLVTHDPTTITSLCQHALWLDKGILRQSGSPKAVTEAYLEAFHQAGAEAKLGAATVASSTAAAAAAAPVPAPKIVPKRDQRQEFLNQTQYRNDLRIFEFDAKAAGFTTGGGRIIDVSLQDADGRPLAWVVGGETVTLRLVAESQSALRRPVLGFFVKNHLGQYLFGDNTDLASGQRDLALAPASRLEARFTFQMPLLPAGDYSILTALADGNAADHVQHHWIHDALVFQSVNSSVGGGLIGLPMLEVTAERFDAVHPLEHRSAA